MFTLISSPVTSEPVLRFLRSSSFLASQLATIVPLLSPASVHHCRAASWLLKSVAVEIRVLASSRQHSQLASILGLLLDRCEAGEDAEDVTSSLYQDSTFSQLSRTVASSHNKQLESPASNHRLAMVLSFIDFEMEAVTSPGWELFDESQVAGVLEQCQVNTLDTMLISVPALHRILSLELATIQVGLIKIFCFDWLKELSITMRSKKF